MLGNPGRHLALAIFALVLAGCVTSEGIKKDGYIGRVDGNARYQFQLVKKAWGYRASQNFEVAVQRLSTETCGGSYREVSRSVGRVALGPAQRHTEMHIVIECLG